MSYILDALNKSDQEKQKRRVTPGLDTRHTVTAAPQRSRWPWAIGFALLVGMNGAALYWWLGQEAAPAKVSQSTPSAITEPVPQPGTEPASPPLPEQGQLITPGDYARLQSNAPPATSAPSSIASLPANIQRDLPELVFSSHIYASDADLRMVNINGTSLREGDIVADDVRLVEITEEGVVLAFRDYEFEVSVLRDWFPPN